MTTELQARAARLFPNNVELQRKWIEAVEAVRKTNSGWLLEFKVPRRDAR